MGNMPAAACVTGSLDLPAGIFKKCLRGSGNGFTTGH
jgi:hypothetical protein